MPFIPDFTDPRYVDEVGWFLYHEKYGRDEFGGSYDAERRAYSRLLLEEVAKYLKQEPTWLEDKTVVSIGCGCSGDLVTFPSRVKNCNRPASLCLPTVGVANAGRSRERDCLFIDGR